MADLDLAQLLINFLALSASYCLFAVGLALVFGVMKVVNFAHGEFFMMGGYAVWAMLAALGGLPPWAALLAAALIGPVLIGLVGGGIEKGMFRPLSADPFAGFIASLGLSYVLQALAALSFGVVSKSLPVLVPGQVEIAGAVLTGSRLVVICGAAVTMAGLWVFLNRSRAGRAVRAASQNGAAARLQGIAIGRVRFMTMAIGAGMAGLAGVLMAGLLNIGPYMGLEAIWKAFIVVIVGGLGSIPGAVVAALLFGFIDSAASSLGFGQFIIIIDTVIMLGVLAFFPRGLMGREGPGIEQGAIKRYPLRRDAPVPVVLACAALGLGALAIFPFLAGGYWLGVGILFLINLLLVISYRTVTTMGGWSFAHITMLAVGAYATALLQTEFGLSFWLILPLAGLAAAFVALIIAWPVMRTRAFYFFLATFAAGEAIRQCFIQFRNPFGGIEGIPFLSPPEALYGFSFYQPINFYVLALGVVALSGALLFTFDRSRTGRSILAMSENENLSAALGKNPLALKILAFCTGSFFAGIAGALFAGYNGFVAPTDYTSAFMFKIIAACIIGGHRSFLGPILGLIVLTALEEALRDLSQLVPLIWGAIIILTMLFLPQGLEGLRLPTRTAKGAAHAARA